MAQADGEADLGIGVDQENIFAAQCEFYAKICTGGCFAHSALLICYGNDLDVHIHAPSPKEFSHYKMGKKKGRMGMCPDGI